MKKDKFEVVRKKLLEMQQDLIRESKAEISQILNKDDKYSGASDDGDLADVACRDSLQAYESEPSQGPDEGYRGGPTQD